MGISNRQIYRALGAENIRHRRRAHPQLSWLPTEQEKVACFESLGLDRRLLPSRVYRGAVGRQRRYFALKLPIAVDSRTATFAYADPGHDTDSELRSWGSAHQELWAVLSWASQSGAGGDPAVQQEIDEIQNALSPPDFSVLNRYGGFNEAGLLAIIGKRIFLDFRRPATGHANLVSGVGSAEMDRSSG